MLKRRTSKRFILAESGEDVTWDPKTDTTNADQISTIPTIAEPDVVKGTEEKTEAAAAAASATASATAQRNVVPQQQKNDNLLKVNTGGLTLK